MILKEDNNSIIQKLHIKPISNLRLNIILCRMQALSLVQPVNKVQVQHLENKFVNGYREGYQALYLSIYKDKDKVLDISDNIVASWSILWKEAKFDAKLFEDVDLTRLSSKMFFVKDNNHHLTTWYRHINNFHAVEKNGTFSWTPS